MRCSVDPRLTDNKVSSRSNSTWKLWARKGRYAEAEPLLRSEQSEEIEESVSPARCFSVNRDRITAGISDVGLEGNGVDVVSVPSSHRLFAQRPEERHWTVDVMKMKSGF